jgi:hypothetical protein
LKPFKFLARLAKAVVTEAIMPALEKIIPHGASEIAHGLYTGHGYVPYGSKDMPLDEPKMTFAQLQKEGNELPEAVHDRDRGLEM